MAEEKPDYSLTDFNVIVVAKDNLLKKLRENRDRHNEIYEASVSGYWLEASKVLEVKKAEFTKARAELDKRFEFSYTNVQEKIGKMDRAFGSLEAPFYFSVAINLAYPTNHLSDYEQAITMLEFSLADKVELTANDFKAYVMNNWAWKQEFVNSNLLYANSYLNNVVAISGCNVFTTGSSFGQFALTSKF